ncbi:TonB-dependent receptor domain-containing protein [Marivirga lumbricoides]
MKKFLLMWWLLAMPFIALSQTITIKDQESNLPIEQVMLISKHPGAFATTNSVGKVDISAFKGAEIIEVRQLSYKPLLISYDAIEAKGFILYMERSNFNLDEVIVSATRWRQTTGNIPAKVVSISPKEVALQNPQTAADMLNISGKVYVQKSQQGGGSPMIRGFATNRLLYTIDGVRMNTAIFRGGNIQNVISLDPFAVESTEVLFGPGSVIYGSDAIGGVMSFRTLTPHFSVDENPAINGHAAVRYSSANNEKTGHVDVNVGWKKWALTTSVSRWDYDDLRQGKFGPEDYLKTYKVERIDDTDRMIELDDQLLQVPSAYSQTNFMQKVRFKPSEKWDFEYGFHFSETSPYGRYDRHNRMRNGMPRYAEWNYGPQKWVMNNLSITHSDNNPAFDQMTIRLAQQSFEESRISRNFNAEMRETRTEEVEAYSINVDFLKDFGRKNTLFYGVEYILNDVTSTGVDENIVSGNQSAGPTRYSQAHWNSIGIYVNNEWKVFEKITVQSGLRYNQFILNADFRDNLDFYPLPFAEAEINNGALTGSIGAVYRPTNTWVISTNFGTAFRSPNVDDIGKVFDSEQGAVTVPNPELKAEYAYNVDAGIAKVFGDVAKVDITGYYTLLNNALVRRNFQLNGRDSILYDGVQSQVQAIQNAAMARVYGIQAGLELKFPGGFNFSSDMNYQVGEEELDDGSTSPSRHAAPLFGTSRLGYKYKKLQLLAYANYQGERSYEDLAVEEQGKDEIYAKDENGNNYSPSWHTLNFKAMYAIDQMFSVNVGIENISDQRYRPYSSGISAPGRNFIVSLSAKF